MMEAPEPSVAATPYARTVAGATYEGPEVIKHVEGRHERQHTQYFFAVCAKLGMSSQAPSGWAKIHVKPHVGCLVYTCSVSVAVATVVVVHIVAVPWGIMIMNIPGLITVVSYVFLAGWIWRFGPAAATAPAYKAASASLSFASSFIVIAVFTGPISYSPFGDRLAFIVGEAVGVFATMLNSLYGGVAADHPPQPYTSIWPGMKNAAFSSMRLVDGLTDIGFVRILLDQDPDCVWYGEAVPCTHYTRLAIIAGVISVSNLLLMIAVLQTTGQLSLFESTGKRFKLVLAANTTIMLLEIGGITMTLLQVFSAMQLPEGRDSERLRREAAFAFASCCTTVCSFCINVLGVSKLLAILRRAGQSVQNRVSIGQRASRVVPAAPQQDA